MFDLAPKLLPVNIGPSRIVKVAGSYEGLVERVLGRGLAVRTVSPTTVALKRACMLGLRLLAVKPAEIVGFSIAGPFALMRENIEVAMVRFV